MLKIIFFILFSIYKEACSGMGVIHAISCMLYITKPLLCIAMQVKYFELQNSILSFSRTLEN
jgi:hypothetical protein